MSIALEDDEQEYRVNFDNERDSKAREDKGEDKGSRDDRESSEGNREIEGRSLHVLQHFLNSP